MSWWRYEKAKGRGFWFVGGEFTVWLMILLAAIGIMASIVVPNGMAFFAGE